ASVPASPPVHVLVMRYSHIVTARLNQQQPELARRLLSSSHLPVAPPDMRATFRHAAGLCEGRIHEWFCEPTHDRRRRRGDRTHHGVRTDAIARRPRRRPRRGQQSMDDGAPVRRRTGPIALDAAVRPPRFYLVPQATRDDPSSCMSSITARPANTTTAKART